MPNVGVSPFLATGSGVSVDPGIEVGQVCESEPVVVLLIEDGPE
jgi:hypothetical protein